VEELSILRDEAWALVARPPQLHTRSRGGTLRGSASVASLEMQRGGAYEVAGPVKEQGLTEVPESDGGNHPSKSRT